MRTTLFHNLPLNLIVSRNRTIFYKACFHNKYIGKKKSRSVSISPLNEILNRFDDGMVCIVFADHDIDRKLTESCYLGWFNKNRISKRIIWAGNSESQDTGPDDEDSFICSGKRISYSSEYLSALRNEIPEMSKSKKGQIQAMILTICDEEHISKETFDCYVGSDRLTVLDNLIPSEYR